MTLAVYPACPNPRIHKIKLPRKSVRRPNVCSFGRIGNPGSMDHPKDQPLCLGRLDFPGTTFPPAPNIRIFAPLGDVRNPRPVVRRWCHGRRWQPPHLGRAGRFFVHPSVSYSWKTSCCFTTRFRYGTHISGFCKGPPTHKNSRVKQ